MRDGSERAPLTLTDGTWARNYIILKKWTTCQGSDPDSHLSGFLFPHLITVLEISSRLSSKPQKPPLTKTATQDRKTVVLNFQSCNPTANDFIPLLHLTLNLHWSEHHALLGRVNESHAQKEKQHSVKLIAGHHKLGSLQCKVSCPSISAKKEGLCQSPWGPWGNWGIQHQAR